MTTTTIVPRPGADEFAPFYAGYVARVPEGDLVGILAEQIGDTLALLESISDDRSLHRYAPGKWSIRDIVLHLADAERIFTYRALRMARGDTTPLAAFDEDRYAAAAGADRRPWSNLLAELEAVRTATVAFYRGLEPEAYLRRGEASGKSISVRALAYITAGHERHHVAVLRERYL